MNINDSFILFVNRIMSTISQFRNNLLFDAQDEYNCSLSLTPMDWSTRGTPRPILGFVCIFSCLLGILPYLACIPVLWDMRRNGCYKLMIYLAFVDIGALMGNIYVGVSFALGEMFCHHPKLHFIANMILIFCFYSSCCSCFIIGVNRFTELLKVRPLMWLFKGSRPWFLMLIPTVYGLFLVLFTPIAFVNSERHFVMVDPGIDNGYQYSCHFLTIQNVAFPSITFTLYSIMTYIMLAKKRDLQRNNLRVSKDTVNRAALMLSAQCGVIVIVHMTTCLGYAILQFIWATEPLRYVMHFGWICIHGCPPYVYFLFNQSVRRGMIQMTTPAPSSTVSSFVLR